MCVYVWVCVCEGVCVRLMGTIILEVGPVLKEADAAEEWARMGFWGANVHRQSTNSFHLFQAVCKKVLFWSFILHSPAQVKGKINALHTVVRNLDYQSDPFVAKTGTFSGWTLTVHICPQESCSSLFLRCIGLNTGSTSKLLFPSVTHTHTHTHSHTGGNRGSGWFSFQVSTIISYVLDSMNV